LDCGVLERTRIDGIEAYRDQIVNIDHHPNPNFGNFNIIEETASSTSEILFKMFSQNGWDIQPSEATAMLAGIVGDTGGFRHSNTTAETLAAAGALLSYGANLALINKTFFELSLAQIKARGLALENAYLDDKNKAIISGITAEDVEKLKLPEGSLAGIVELLNTCTEAQYAALCKQREDEVRVSLRTEEYKNFDVAELATKHGGGGMKLAAVFRVKGTLVKDEKGLAVELE
ncbi:MAG TPA: DHH family phosphoesterase, partial [Flavobacterium sp.]|nr:DHH family phosphoesterase [Flavobacterium sp.]